VLLSKRIKDIDHQRQVADRKIEQLELDTTRFNLNPHFFRNSLTTLQGTIQKSLNSVEKLSDVLEYVLYDAQTNFISLRKEIEFARKFVEYNETRTGARFSVKFSDMIPENSPFLDYEAVAPMITAYFIENAFKHSDVKSEDGFVHVFVRLDDGFLKFTVENKARTEDSPKLKGGMGKENMNKRLMIFFKDKFDVQYDFNLESRIHRATLKLDLNNEKNPLHIVG
jgi:LytS/YehU family sensor histidine kinase